MSIRRATGINLLAFFVLSATLAGARPASGQTYTILYPFKASVRITSSLVEVAPGEFYGTTVSGGAWSQGSVVKVTTAGAVTTLHSFSSNVDGDGPVAGLVYDGAGGFLYGTTTNGGLNGRGAIFRIKPDGTSFEKVYDFLAGSDPFSPEAALIKGSDGKLYGTSRLGGANGLGTVFSLDVSTPPATLTTLHSFSGGATDGAGPVSSLFESGGYLYGTTVEGGNGPDWGTVFKISTSGSMQWVTPFPLGGLGGALGGANPVGGVVEKGGVFYGTTEAGGSTGGGTVFEVTDAGVLTKVYEFNSKGAIPEAGLTLGADGLLYGTTKMGGANYLGTVFRIDPSAVPVVEETVHSFSGTNGSYPTTGLVLGSDTRLFGTTSEGGPAGYGTAYWVQPVFPTSGVFYADPGDEGAGPFSPLYRDGGGVLYGTASVGGKSVGGAIYRLDPCAIPPCVLTTLRATQDLGMGQDFSGVVPGPGGFLYGTAKASNSIYKIDTLNGSGFQKLYTFTGSPGNFPNGSFPIGVMERSGILYGATATGGASDKGTLFALDPASPSSLGWSTPLSGTDGRYPSSQLVAGSDGKLYGVTSAGGASDKGTLFRVSTAGTHELLHSFSGPDGSNPWAALTPAGPGTFYGTTAFGGANGVGTFFRLDATTTPATVQTLRNFAAGEVEGVSVLTLGGDGNFYGTSYGWGANGLGSVIQLAPSGALRILFSFSGTDGAFPLGGVLRLSDGTLLGTTVMAGPRDGGVVFQLNPATSAATAVVSGGGPTCAGGTVTLAATLTGTPPWSLTWSDGFVQSVSVSPATRVVTPSVSTIYTLTAFSDAFGEGTVSGSGSVTVSGVAPSTVVTAPASAAPNATGLTASVPDAGGGATYAWTVTNGAPVSGQNARIFTFNAPSGGFIGLSVTVTTGPTCSATGSAAVAVGSAAANSITFTHLAGTSGGPGAIDANGTASRFNQPTAVAFDGAGNLYVADSAYTIRRISASGDVTTLAGLAGSRGSADGTGSSARFWHGYGLALDGAGNLYVSDYFNHTIRKVTPSGVVSTYLGVAGSYGSVGGIGSAARLYYPTGLAVDLARNVLYVAERGSHVIRRVDLATGEIFPYAGLAGSSGNVNGTGSAARFFAPLGLAIDGSGTLYVSDSSNHAIRKVTRAGAPVGAEGDVTTLASGFVFPGGLAADGLGNLYVADSGGPTVHRVVIGTGAVSTVAGLPHFQGTEDGTGSAARFYSPVGVATDASGNAWIADAMVSTSIRKVTPAGFVTTPFGAPAAFGPGDGTGSAARFNWPRSVAVDKDGNAWVADTQNNSIRKVTPAGDVSTFAGPSAGLYWPMGIAVDAAGNVYVGDTNNHVIRKITPLGSVSLLAGSVGNAGNADGLPADARFKFPRGVAVDASGNVYVADSKNSLVRKVTPGGVVSTLAAGFAEPTGVAVDAFGFVYVADSGNCAIRQISPGGAVTTLAGVVGSCGYVNGNGSAARFSLPTGIALDAVGNLYVTDLNGNRLRKVTQAGAVTTLVANPTFTAGSDDGTDDAAQFWNPEGIAVDPSGNLIVADTVNSAIRIGRPALAVAATIDATTGSVGVARQLGTSAAATTYAWEVIRRPSGSTAAVSSTSSRTPTFTPDVADLYVFRLTASNGTNTSITLVSLAASPSGCTPPTAVASGSAAICAGGSTPLTGSGGVSCSWSPATGLSNASSCNPAASPSVTTVYTLTVTDGTGCVSTNNPAVTVTVNAVPATPVITAPGAVGEGSPNRTASVPNHAGSTYAWAITNGTITSVQGTSQVKFTAGSQGTLNLSVVETSAAGCASAAGNANVVVAPPGTALLFYTLPPCRVLDTRNPAGPLGGPALAANEIRDVAPGGSCGIPATAKALAANVTVLAPDAAGFLRIWGVGETQPSTSTLNFSALQTRANNAVIVMPAGAAAGFRLQNGSLGTTPVLVDVSGYFE